MMLSTAELFARYLRIALMLKAGSKEKVRIGGKLYTPKDAARHYCGSERLTRVGVLIDYVAWLKAGIK
jgi:hypothetical protein